MNEWTSPPSPCLKQCTVHCTFLKERVEQSSNGGWADADMSVPASITVTAPAAGHVWELGATYTVTFTAAGSFDTVVVGVLASHGVASYGQANMWSPRTTASFHGSLRTRHLSLLGASKRRPRYRTGPAPSEDDGYHLDRPASLALTKDRWSAPSISRSALSSCLWSLPTRCSEKRCPRVRIDQRSQCCGWPALQSVAAPDRRHSRHRPTQVPVDISPSELYCLKLESAPKKLCEAEVRVCLSGRGHATLLARLGFGRSTPTGNSSSLYSHHATHSLAWMIVCLAFLACLGVARRVHQTARHPLERRCHRGFLSTRMCDGWTVACTVRAQR